MEKGGKREREDRVQRERKKWCREERVGKNERVTEIKKEARDGRK